MMVEFWLGADSKMPCVRYGPMFGHAFRFRFMFLSANVPKSTLELKKNTVDERILFKQHSPLSSTSLSVINHPRPCQANIKLISLGSQDLVFQGSGGGWDSDDEVGDPRKARNDGVRARNDGVRDTAGDAKIDQPWSLVHGDVTFGTTFGPFFFQPLFQVTKQRKELEKKSRLSADQVVQLAKVMVP